MEKGDNGRWGALDVIPTKADYVLDLHPPQQPLAAALGPRLLRDGDDVRGDQHERHGPLQHVPVPSQPATGGRAHRCGHLTTKMAGPLVRLWEQMPEPKWCVAMGDCTCSGGRYKRSYATVEGIDRVMPVDVYVPGCPPRPEGLIYGMMKLQQLIRERRGHWAERAVGPTVPARRLSHPTSSRSPPTDTSLKRRLEDAPRVALAARPSPRATTRRRSASPPANSRRSCARCTTIRSSASSCWRTSPASTRARRCRSSTTSGRR